MKFLNFIETIVDWKGLHYFLILTRLVKLSRASHIQNLNRQINRVIYILIEWFNDLKFQLK